MSFENAKKHLDSFGLGDRVMTFGVSSATVALAAAAVGTEPARIVKSLAFKAGGAVVMILCAGDAKISNAKFKEYFHVKASMLPRGEVCEKTGHEAGGVCPFGVKDGVRIYLDASIKRFDVVYPACGSADSAVQLTVEELEKVSGGTGWIDVCQLPPA